MPEKKRPYQLDKRLIRTHFDRAANTYDNSAVLQQNCAQQLLERLSYIRIKPATIIDLGAGTGILSKALSERFPKARVTALDLAPAMLSVARQQQSFWQRWQKRQGFVCGDMEMLPFAGQSCDLIISNMALQWCNDLDQCFREFRRILRPGGLLMFTTCGPDTLKELRQCWRQIDNHDHVNAFIDMHDIGDALLRAGLSEPVMDRDDYTLTYPDLRTLLHDLKAIGANNSLQGRARGLTGRQRLQWLQQHYETFRQHGLLPASYEIIHGHCWSTNATGKERASDNTTIRVPLTELRQYRADR